MAAGSGRVAVRPAADHGTNLKAAGLTVVAVSLFAVSDAVIKLLAAVYPPGQIDQAQPADGDQVGSTGAGADEMNGHATRYPRGV